VLNPLEGWVQEGLQPDLTFWFDLPPEQAAERRAAPARRTVSSSRTSDFFERVRAGYAAAAARRRSASCASMPRQSASRSGPVVLHWSNADGRTPHG
jgi:thymidylate kinase